MQNKGGNEMAILSGFKSFERYLKVPTENENKYQLVSERTLAKDIIFNDNSNLENKMNSVLYIVSFDSSTGTLTTKSSDYTG